MTSSFTSASQFSDGGVKKKKARFEPPSRSHR